MHELYLNVLGPSMEYVEDIAYEVRWARLTLDCGIRAWDIEMRISGPAMSNAVVSLMKLPTIHYELDNRHRAIDCCADLVGNKDGLEVPVEVEASGGKLENSTRTCYWSGWTRKDGRVTAFTLLLIEG